MVRGEPSCRRNGITKLSQRSNRALAGLLVGLVALVGGQMAWAHQSPAGCTGNQLDVDLLKDKTSILNGETVTFTATLSNDDSTACDVTATTITFHCPAPDGTPTGATTVCATNADFLVPFAPINLCVVACTVNFNPGVTSAQALIEGSGTLHDNPENDLDRAEILRTLSVIIRICGDGQVGNTPGETCDPPGSIPPTPPGNTNVCRPLGPDQCTYCGDNIVNNGEICDDGNAVDTDTCRNNCTPPICGDGILNQACETCDGAAFPATAPATHGDCRTGITCGADSCTFCGDNIVNGGEQCDDGNAVDTDACRNNCTPPLPCSVIIAKTVAPDDGGGGGTACDGVADGAFVENVTVDQTTCVVYQICVTNTGQQILDGNGVKVSDPVLGTVNLDFGTIAPDQTVCKQAPGVFTAPNCTGGSPAGTSCLCSEVAGVNTATITSAICEASNENACTQPGSDCSDTANVACLAPGSCRMTGGHNYDVVDAAFNENGKVYTTGGQIGAPNETGCCDLPPKGKCVNGLCTGGSNGGNACTSNEDCPNDPGRNSHCPWGDWEHNHHSGSDDTGSVKGGSFAFHSGTAAAPNEAFIKSVLCADPGWCVQARPAPFKQIFWEGTGVFHNIKGPKGTAVPLPVFGACGSQPVPWSNKTDGTLHYYKAHVSDFGEPAGIFQKPVGACRMDESCTNPEPNGAVEISNCALGDVCLVDSVTDPVKTALHPLCLAQTCSECPDAYEIEIHCTADPTSPVAYRVSHFIRQGNFQLHPPVGDSCNPGCGNGVCEAGVTGTAETCQSCPEDCCP